MVVIKQTKYLLRAISIENGNEKWNISLIKNQIIMHPVCNRNLATKDNKYSQGYDKRFNLERIYNIKSKFDDLYDSSNQHLVLLTLIFLKTSITIATIIIFDS